MRWQATGDKGLHSGLFEYGNERPIRLCAIHAITKGLMLTKIGKCSLKPRQGMSTYDPVDPDIH